MIADEVTMLYGSIRSFASVPVAPTSLQHLSVPAQMAWSCAWVRPVMVDAAVCYLLHLRVDHVVHAVSRVGDEVEALVVVLAAGSKLWAPCRRGEVDRRRAGGVRSLVLQLGDACARRPMPGSTSTTSLNGFSEYGLPTEGAP